MFYFSENTTSALSYTVIALSLFLFFLRIERPTPATHHLTRALFYNSLQGLGWLISTVSVHYWQPITIPFQMLMGLCVTIHFWFFSIYYTDKTLRLGQVSFLQKLEVSLFVLIGLGISATYTFVWFTKSIRLNELASWIVLVALIMHVQALLNYWNCFRKGVANAPNELLKVAVVHAGIPSLIILSVLFSFHLMPEGFYYSSYTVLSMLIFLFFLSVYVNQYDGYTSLSRKIQIATLVLALIPAALASRVNATFQRGQLFNQYSEYVRLLDLGGIDIDIYPEILYARKSNVAKSFRGSSSGFSREQWSKGVFDVSYVFESQAGEFSLSDPKYDAKQVVFFGENSQYEIGLDYIPYRREMNSRLQRGVFSVFIVVFSIMVIFPIVYNPILLKPLDQLSQGVRQIDSGSYGIPIPISNNDQIGQIIQIVNKASLGLDQYSSSMEEMVIEKTQSLKKSTADLEDQLAFRTDIITHVSHELRTPLGPIIGYSSFLLDTRPNLLTDAGAMNDLRAIREMAIHLLHVLNQVLSYSKMQKHRVLLSLEPIGFSDVLGKIGKLGKGFNLLYAENYKFSTVCESELLALSIDVDVQKLDEILANLLSNAFKYNVAGGWVSVVLSTTEGWLHIEVSDGGVGIPAHLISRLFTQFDRLGVTNVPGAGLGLYLSFVYARELGGTIAVKSEEGKGATFTLSLPVKI
jgi:signal transduction histidine kinase